MLRPWSKGPLALVILGTVACGANVRITDDDDGSGGSVTTSPKGGESVVSPVGGASSTSASGGATSTGSGGSEPDPDDEAEALVKAQCPDVGAEQHFCVMLGYPNTLFAVGPDSGSLCYLGEIQGFGSSEVSSIAVVGPNVHGCVNAQQAWRAPVLGGQVELLTTPCEALTEYQGGFLLQTEVSDDNLRHYADFESVGTDTPLETFWVDGNYSRISTRGDTLFTAWHATDTVDVAALPSGSPLASLSLEGFDDWIDGMSATSDGRLYVLSVETVIAFDVATGEQLQQVNIPTSGTPLSALHCWTN